MSMHPPESRLLDLVTGLLSPDDSKATMDHVRRCAECEARLRLLVADREALRAGPAPTLIDGRIELPQPRAPRRTTWIRAGLVAAVLAVVAIGAFQLTNREGAPEYWIPVQGEAVLMRSQNGKTGVGDVLQSYQQRDAKSAVVDLQRFQPSPDDKTSTTLRHLYLASALINAGRSDEGLEIVDRLDIPRMPTPWRYEAEWVKYIGLRRAGRDDDARSWLEKLSAEPGENRTRAQSELKRRDAD